MKIKSTATIHTPGSSCLEWMSRHIGEDGEKLLVEFSSGAVYAYYAPSFEDVWADLNEIITRGDSVGKYFAKVKKTAIMGNYERVTK